MESMDEEVERQETRRLVRELMTLFGGRSDDRRMELYVGVLGRSRVSASALHRALREGPESWQRMPAPADVIRLAAQYHRERVPTIRGEEIHGLRPVTYGATVGDRAAWYLESQPGRRVYLQDHGPHACRVYQDIAGTLMRAGWLTRDPAGVARYTPEGTMPDKHPQWGEPLPDALQRRIFGRVIGGDPLAALRTAIRDRFRANPRT